MTLDESVEYLTVVVFIAVEVTVLFYVAPAWKRLRHPFLALFAVGSVLGLYVTVSDYTVGRNPASVEEYYWYWIAGQAVSMASMITYGAGAYLMVRHLLNSRGSGKSSVSLEVP